MSDNHPAERKAWMTGKFQELFKQPPTLWFRAPGRVDLMGSHTDYNQGHVMTMTIDRDTWLAARPRSDRQVAIYSLNVPGGGAFSLDPVEHDTQTRWTNYVRGVAWSLQSGGSPPLRGFDGLIHSTIPFGSGLSSSAALEMSTLAAFQHINHLNLDPVSLALAGQKAENQFVGVQSGILDQYSSIMGQACRGLLLDCRSLTSRSVPIPDYLKVVICDTRAERNLAGTEYGERRAQCEEGARILKQFYPSIQTLRDVTPDMLQAHRSDLPPATAKRCQFIVEEDQRVLDLAEALPAGDTARLNALLSASYEGARDLYEISAPCMEAMMAAMLCGPGIVGARQAGAGFGGCMVALVESGCVAGFSRHVCEDYQRRTGITPQVFAVEASPGAGLI